MSEEAEQQRPETKEVRVGGVALISEGLRGHEAWRAAQRKVLPVNLLALLLLLNHCKTEIGYSQFMVVL